MCQVRDKKHETGDVKLWGRHLELAATNPSIVRGAFERTTIVYHALNGLRRNVPVSSPAARGPTRRQVPRYLHPLLPLHIR